jgi:hypothetical protein
VYDLRYSTAAINSTNFASATAVAGEPTPAAAGTTQGMTVSGLMASTTYYFALKTADEVPNWSALSNVPAGTTTGTASTSSPLAPTGLTLLQSNRLVELTWAPNSEASLAGYRIYRRPTGSAWTLRTSSLLAVTSFMETLAVKHGGYEYQVTAVNTAGEESPPSLPASVAPLSPSLLSDPMPNPFNQFTRIQVAVPEEGLQIKAAIYDIRGRKVCVLREGFVTGDLDLTWDGSDDTGRRAPHGIYFLQIDTDQESARKKLTLTR